MTEGPLERDDVLTDALRAAAEDPTHHDVDWDGLRRAIAQRAAPELARRRKPRRARIVIPATLAASFVLFALVTQVWQRGASVDDGATLAAAPLTIDDIFDADVSDRQFRALLFGAAEADALLLMAASDRELP